MIRPRDGLELYERLEASLPENLDGFDPESWGASVLVLRALSPRIVTGSTAILLTSATFLFGPLPFDLSVLGVSLRQLVIAALAAWTLRPAWQLSRLSDEELEERPPDPPPA